MNVIFVVIALAAIGLLGIVTKSIVVILWGVAGVAVSFLVFCAGALLGLLWKLVALILSLALIGAAIIFFPFALLVIIPGICFAFMYAMKKNRSAKKMRSYRTVTYTIL